MQDDEEFKRGCLGIKCVGDKIFVSSQRGKLYSFDKVSQQACWSREIDILPPFSNARYMVDPSFIIMYSHSVTEVSINALCSSFENNGYRLIRFPSKLVGLEKLTYCHLFQMQDGARSIDKPVVPKPMEYGFPPEGKYAVKWSAGNDGILINHQLGMDVLCIERHESDDASNISVCACVTSWVKMFSRQGSQEYDNVNKVSSFGTFILVFFGFEPFFGKCRRVVNGVRALHDKETAIGNFSIDNIFVDEHINVKIAPINQNRKFPSSKNTKLNLITSSCKATNFSSSKDAKGK
nr:hypothetical protein [Tanacetum cinerariifolium]